jgi:imidazolonepropionase-like amidohydrolase
MKYIPTAELEELKPENNFLLKYRTPEFIRVKKLLYQKEFDLVREMHRARVGFLLGTDIPGYGYTGFTVHDELALFVQAGFTPLEALETTTINPAKFLGLEKSLGTIEKGKLADLVLLDADPLENIANTKKISAVIINGKYLPKDSLQKMLADVEAIANKK